MCRVFRGLGTLSSKNTFVQNRRQFPDRAAGLAHDSPRTLNAHISGQLRFKTTIKIPRVDPQRDTETAKMVAGKGRKSAKFWASHPSGLQPSVPHPSGPHPSDNWGETLLPPRGDPQPLRPPPLLPGENHPPSSPGRPPPPPPGETSPLRGKPSPGGDPPPLPGETPPLPPERPSPSPWGDLPSPRGDPLSPSPGRPGYVLSRPMLLRPGFYLRQSYFGQVLLRPSLLRPGST